MWKQKFVKTKETDFENASIPDNQFELPSFDKNFNSDEFQSKNEGKSQPFESEENNQQFYSNPQKKNKIIKEEPVKSENMFPKKEMSKNVMEDPFSEDLQNNNSDDFFDMGVENHFEQNFKKQLNTEIKKSRRSNFLNESGDNKRKEFDEEVSGESNQRWKFY
jgi:hypothetical protein